MVSEERIAKVAHTLYFEVYEQAFGGKDRGRFQVSREDIKQLLGVQRLHQPTIQKLIDACLELGLVVIDMDETFAFAETTFVQKWRKLPVRLAKEHANSINQEEDDELDEFIPDHEDGEEEEE